MRGLAVALLLAASLGLALHVAARMPASIDLRLAAEGRRVELDGWVARTAPYLWGAAAAAALAAALAPSTLPAITVRTGRRGALLLAVAATGAAAWVAHARMDRVPHVFDEFNYLFQAKNFAQGQLSARTPPQVDHFNQLFFVIRGDRWFGSSLPGHPLVLALGVLAGVPWLVSPLAAGLTLLCLHRFWERVLGAGPALCGAALLFASPFFTILSGTYMAHGTALLACAALLHFGTRFVDEGSAGDGALAGLAFGVGFLARPQALLAWALPLLCYGLARLARGATPLRGRAGRALVAVALPIVPLLAFDLVQNRVLTGAWMDTPRSFVSPSHRLGFGEDVGRPTEEGGHTGHTPAKGVENVLLNVRILGRDLFGWWGASLLLLPFALPGLRERGTALAAANLLLAAGVCFAYFTPSPIYGPRYFFETIPALCLLTLEGGRRLAALLGGGDAPTRGLLGGFGFLCAASLLLYRTPHLDRYQPLTATPLRRALAELPPGRALVLTPPGFFGMRAQSFNDPDLENEVLLGADLGVAKNRALLAAMPDRTPYRLRFDRAAESATITPYERDALRVVVAGMDSATWSVIDPLIAAGQLPTFARLKGEGAWGSLATLEPTYSPAIWTTIATGVLPAKHGITHFVVPAGADAEGESDRITTSAARKSAAIWEMVGQRALRANVLNYWCTWPAESITGAMVTDRATIPGLPHRVHPDSLLPWVEGRLGLDRRATGGMSAAQHAGVDEERLVDAFVALSDRDPAALGIVYLRRLDIEQHQSWKYLEPEGFDVRPEEVATKRDRIPAVYRAYDGYLAKLRAAMPPEAILVVVSDHGMESAARLPREIVLRVNRLLAALSLTTFAEGSPLPDRARSAAVGAPAPVGGPVVVELLDPARAADVRGRIGSLRLRGAPLLELVEESTTHLTYRLSPVAAEHRGSLDPPHDALPWAGLVGERMHATSGQHDHAPPGILIVQGPGVAPGRVDGASVEDLTPTILALLGLPQDEGFDGAPLVELLPESARRQLASSRAVRYVRRPPVVAELPPDLAERTRDELRTLGYLP